MQIIFNILYQNDIRLKVRKYTKLKHFIIIYAILCTISQISTAYAKDSVFDSNIFYNYTSNNTLGNNNFLKDDDKINLGGNLKFTKSNFDTYINLINSNKNIAFDNSYIQYSINRTTFGLGTVDRNWSFSSKSSLILSSNARPFKSVYLKYTNTDGFNTQFLSAIKGMSFEIFNGMPKSAQNPYNSMLFGLRGTMSTNNLDFEVMRVLQWGGDGFSNNPSTILETIFGSSNEGKNANINQMAGFGISYRLPETILPLRIYGQIIGEDESGNLPSCLIYMAGTEWTGPILNKKSKLGVEIVDTQVSLTESNNCGPNTAYNNNTYFYTNNGTSMGAPIDSEGNSIEFFVHNNLNSNLTSNFSIKKLFVNKKKSHYHRLSSNSKSGWTNSIGLSWKRNKLAITGEINYQSILLEKYSDSKGIGAKIFTNLDF